MSQTNDEDSRGMSPMSRDVHSHPGVREGRYCALLEGERRSCGDRDAEAVGGLGV